MLIYKRIFRIFLGDASLPEKEHLPKDNVAAPALVVRHRFGFAENTLSLSLSLSVSYLSLG